MRLKSYESHACCYHTLTFNHDLGHSTFHHFTIIEYFVLNFYGSVMVRVSSRSISRLHKMK